MQYFSGIVAPEGVKKDLLNTYSLEEEQVIKIYKERMKSKGINFHDYISLLKLKTFSTMVGRNSVQLSRKDDVCADSKLFVRLLVTAKAQGMDLRSVLWYEFRTFTTSLATVDASMFKTVKSNLLALLEVGVPL